MKQVHFRAGLWLLCGLICIMTPYLAAERIKAVCLGDSRRHGEAVQIREDGTVIVFVGAKVSGFLDLDGRTVYVRRVIEGAHR